MLKHCASLNLKTSKKKIKNFSFSKDLISNGNDKDYHSHKQGHSYKLGKRQAENNWTCNSQEDNS